MPNVVTNMLSFDSLKDFEKVVEFMKSKKQDFDFNNLIKMPQDIKNEDVMAIDTDIVNYDGTALTLQQLKEKYGESKEAYTKVKEYVNNYLEYGYMHCLDWSLNLWGTKWNAYSIIVSKKHKIIFFDTAWNSVTMLMELLSKITKTSFFYQYADENRGYNTGFLYLSHGKLTYGTSPNGSDSAQTIYVELREWLKRVKKEQKKKWN